jgi:hypothetical protein
LICHFLQREPLLFGFRFHERAERRRLVAVACVGVFAVFDQLREPDMLDGELFEHAAQLVVLSLELVIAQGEHDRGHEQQQRDEHAAQQEQHAPLAVVEVLPGTAQAIEE